MEILTLNAYYNILETKLHDITLITFIANKKMAVWIRKSGYFGSCVYSLINVPYLFIIQGPSKLHFYVSY